MILSAFTVAAKRLLLSGRLTPDETYRVALYSEEAELDSLTPGYTPQGEVEGMGYKAGGLPCRMTPTVGDSKTAWLTFTPVTWPSSTIKARGLMVYSNTLPGNPAVAVVDFNEIRDSKNGDFKVTFPEKFIEVI